MECPLCRAELPEGASACTRCDWFRRPPDQKGNPADLIAAILSLVPGLGHVYKGHILLGGLLLLALSPMVLALVLAAVPGTLGLSLLILPVYMAGIAVHASQMEDRRAEFGKTVTAA